MFRQNLVRIGPVVLEKKMLTDDDGRPHLAIDHLSVSDSGDLKTPNKQTNKQNIKDESKALMSC